MKTNTLETVTLHITPLSPVHVGIGEDYEPTNYVMEDGVLFSFDSDVANRVLTEQQRKDLLDMVSKSTRRAEDMIKQVQYFFYNNRKPLAAASSHFLPVSAGVFDLYQKRVGQSANRESGGKSVINKLEIQRTFFNPYSQQPIIPGSSIKGAIRTALLDHINGGKPLKQVEDRRTHKWRKENNQELQERLMRGKFATDPMRLISLGDANYQTPTLFGSEIRFAVDRKKKQVLKDGKPVQSQAEAKNLYQLLECLSPLRYRSFSGSLTVQDLGNLDARDKTPDKELRWTVQDIGRACNDFYLKQFEKELAILKERRYSHPDWEKLANQVQNGVIKRKLDGGKVFLLRVGRHSGAESVTLNGVRSIKILEGKGENGKQKSSYQSEAKTVWLAANTEKDRSGMLPFGWVLVEVSPQPDREVEELLKPFLGLDQQRQKKLKPQPSAAGPAEAPPPPPQNTTQEEIWKGARVTYNKGNREISATISNQPSARARGKDAEEVLNQMSDALRQKLTKKGEIAATVSVKAVGNDRRVIKIED